MRSLSCPQCTTPFEAEALPPVITYPNEVSQLFKFLDGRLFLCHCPFCKTPILATSSICVLQKEKCIILSSDDAFVQHVLTLIPGIKAIRTTELDKAQLELAEWVTADLLQMFYQPGKQRSDNGSPTPLQLRALLAASKGLLGVKLVSADDPAKPVDIGEMYKGVVTNAIISIVNDHMLSDVLLDLPVKLLENIPDECLTDEILKYFEDICDGIEEARSWSHLHRNWLYVYISVVLHYLAGKTTPRGRDLVHYALVAWDNRSGLESQPPVVFRQMILNAGVIEKLISKKVFMDVALLTLVEKPASTIDVDRYSKLSEDMGFYGWGRDFSDLVFERILIRTTPLSRPADEIIEDVVRKHSITVNKKEEANLADTNAAGVSREIKVWLQSGYFDIANGITQQLLSYFENQQDPRSYIIMGLETAQMFRHFFYFDTSNKILLDIGTKYLPVIKSLSPYYQFFYYYEASLALSYKDDRATYKLQKKAQKVLRQYPELKQLNSKPDIILKYERASLHRRTGEYHKGLRLYSQIRAEHGNDFLLAQNLSNLYFEINQPEKGLECLLPFDKMAMPGQIHFVYIQSAISYAYILCERQQEAFERIRRLLGSITNTTPLDLRLQLYNCILSMQEEFIRRLDEEYQIIRRIESSFTEGGWEQLSFTTKFFLLIWYVKTRQMPQATRVYQTYLQHVTLSPGPSDSYFTYVLLCYFFENAEYEKAAKLLIHLFSVLDKEIPARDNAYLSINWLQGKEDVQKDALRIAYTLYRKGMVSSVELLGAIDLNYGKEISAKFTRTGQLMPQTEVIETISRNHPHAEFFLFFEIGEDIHMAHLAGADGSVRLYENIFFQKEIEKIKIELADAFKFVSPAYPEMLDHRLAGFRDVAGRLSAIITECVKADTRNIYIAPGKCFSNFPLQLVQLPSKEYLLEKYQLAFIHNLSSLAQIGEPGVASDRLLLVAAKKASEIASAKRNDDERFEQIKGRMEGLRGTLTILTGEKATISSVKAHLQRSDEVVFMCHGGAGTTEEGRGICLYHKGLPPPSFLYTKDVQYLKNFLLTWKDLDKLKKTPKLVVSLACSNGLVNIEKGGVHFGFEQAVFGKGTRAIISPLWDIEHDSALFWLDRFYYHRSAMHDVGGSWKLACMDARDKYKHFYFWAAFIIKGVTN